jgi:hypothetical protein
MQNCPLTRLAHGPIVNQAHAVISLTSDLNRGFRELVLVQLACAEP